MTDPEIVDELGDLTPEIYEKLLKERVEDGGPRFIVIQTKLEKAD